MSNYFFKCAVPVPSDIFVLLPLQLKGKDGGKTIGRISKQWSGLLKEGFTDTDNFGIQFPLDLDVKLKAVLMGACFLIVRTHSHILIHF